jgi:hypothetical protein
MLSASLLTVLLLLHFTLLSLSLCHTQVLLASNSILCASLFLTAIVNLHSVTSVCLTVPLSHIFCKSTLKALAGLTTSRLSTVPQTHDFTRSQLTVLGHSECTHTVTVLVQHTVWLSLRLQSTHCQTDSAQGEHHIHNSQHAYGFLGFEIILPSTGMWGARSGCRKWLMFECITARRG